MATRNIHGIDNSSQNKRNIDKNIDKNIKKDKKELTPFAQSFPEWDIVPPDNLVVRIRRRI